MSAAQSKKALSKPAPARNTADRVDIHVHLPTRTIIKIILTLVAGWAALRLWPEFALLLVAVVLAIAMYPAVTWLKKRRLSHGTAILVIALGMLLLVVGFLALISTSLAEQISRLVQDFPGFRARIERRIPADYPVLRRIIAEIFALPDSPEIASHLQRPLALGTSALAVAASLFLIMIVTLYLLLDGKRVYAWLIAYVPRKHRDDVAVTASEVSAVVYDYVRAQVITSLLFTGFAGALLWAFRVPAALPLALLAGFCDVLPVVGVVLAIAPAALLAFSVSLTAGLGVTAGYVAYHAIESYYIVPRVYGARLRLSTLAVLLALIVGTALQGLIGAVLILPLVAAYPIVERIWLTGYLSPEVIKDHDALDGAGESDDEGVVDTVLQGEKHPWEGTATVTSPGMPASAPKAADAAKKDEHA